MPLNQSILDSDKNYLTSYVYFNDTNENDIDLAKKGKVRIEYQNKKYLLTKDSDFSGFNKNRFDCIKDYLMQNTIVNFTYAGASASGVDPLTKFVGNITSFTYNPPQYMSSQNDFAIQITNLLNSAIIEDKLKQVIATGVFKFNTINISSIATSNDYNSNVSILSGEIIKAVTSAIGFSITATHGIYTGPAIIDSIVVS